MHRYRGFAQVEYDHLREHVSGFEWTTFAEPSPRQLPAKPLRRARVALVATAGAHLPGQPPFARGRGGDASYREIPATSNGLRFSHVGYDTRRAETDPDVVFPLALLRRLAAQGEIGELAPRAFSFMGYIPEPQALLKQTAPAVARELRADAVDLVLLVPS